jgi:hypothetical protein
MTSEKIICVGIDWADKDHASHMIHDGKKTIVGYFKQSPEDIENLIKDWRKRCPGCTFAIAIETNKGPLIIAPVNYDDILIYPINPAPVHRFVRQPHGSL